MIELTLTPDVATTTFLLLTNEELGEVAAGCTCEKFDDGSGGLTVKPH